MAQRQSILVGVFNDRGMAERAIEGLHDAGIGNNQISYSGAAASGGFLEELKSVFTGDTSGAGDVAGDLKKMGIPANEADYYANEYRTGHPILAVKTNGRMQEVANILSSNGGYTYSSRANAASNVEKRQAGTYAQTADRDQAAATRAKATGDDQDIAGKKERLGSNETRSIPVREEQLEVEKQRVQSGEVRVHKDVVTEQKTINVPVNREEVVVERHPASGEQVSETPIGQGETVRIPVSEEQVTITKQPVVTGEVEISKRTVQEQKQYTDTVKREEVNVEPVDENLTERMRREGRIDQGRRKDAQDYPDKGDNRPLP